jgi:uncharacterized protein GlcG (DUF336 family)
VTRLRIIVLSTLALAVFPAVSFGQVPTASEIRDGAGIFEPEIIRKAIASLQNMEKKARLTTLIETVESVSDGSIVEVAARNARTWGMEGLYILIDKDDRKFELVVTRGFQSAINHDRQLVIRDSFLDAFKKKDFNGGLLKGVEAIRATNLDAREKGKPSLEATNRTKEEPSRRTEVELKANMDLVVRNQVRLTLAGARRIIAGAEERAADLKLKFNIAVVDDGGHLLAFERMDGARPASGYTAITKATTAATFRAETGPLPKGTTAPDPLLNLSLQNAAAASGGKLTTLLGGVPVLVDGQVIGGVGVGGGSGEQDVDVARAGIARFLHALEFENDDVDKKPGAR